MKTIFVAANFACGALALFFGLIALMDSTHHPLTSVLLGGLAFGLGATCIWIARACSPRYKSDAAPSTLLLP